MNHWEVLIIPLIAFGAWILSMIFKAAEDEKTKAQARRPQGVRPPRRPMATAAPQRLEPPRRRDMPEGMESQQQRNRPAPPARPAQAARSAPPARRSVPVLATIIEEPPQPVVRQRTVAAKEAAVLLPVPQPVPPPPPPAPPTKRDRPISPVLQETVRLLRSPKTAAVAFVMREILDRPVALRRR